MNGFQWVWHETINLYGFGSGWGREHHIQKGLLSDLDMLILIGLGCIDSNPNNCYPYILVKNKSHRKLLKSTIASSIAKLPLEVPYKKQICKQNCIGKIKSKNICK